MLDVSTLPPARLALVIRAIESAGQGFHAPLYRAVLAGELSLLILRQGERVPLRVLERLTDARPQMIVLAGDDGRPGGPEAFPQAERLLRWARFIILHAAAGKAAHYDLAVSMAQSLGRLLLIEAGSAEVAAWSALRERIAPATPGLGIAPPDGVMHPVPARPASRPSCSTSGAAPLDALNPAARKH